MGREGQKNRPSLDTMASSPLMSSVAASPASLFQWRDDAEEWLTNAGSGPLFAGLSNSSDHPLWLSKTSRGCCQLMMDGSSEEYLETWPASGSMRNGKCYRQPPLVRRISERESSLLPTPQNHDSRSQGLKREVKDGRIQAANGGESQSLNLGTLAATGLIPTPQAQDYKSGTGYDHGNKKQTPQMRHLSGGLLNPQFVEAMMGFPIGFSDSSASGTQ